MEEAREGRRMEGVREGGKDGGRERLMEGAREEGKEGGR